MIACDVCKKSSGAYTVKITVSCSPSPETFDICEECLDDRRSAEMADILMKALREPMTRGL